MCLLCPGESDELHCDCVIQRSYVIAINVYHCCVDAERDDAEYNELTAYVGDDVWLNCTSSSTDVTGVEWWYHRQSGRDPVYREVIQDDYKQQFTVREHSNMEYYLVIRNVTVDNSGTYECVDETGQGRSHYNMLNVTGISLCIYLLYCAPMFEKLSKLSPIASVHSLIETDAAGLVGRLVK